MFTSSIKPVSIGLAVTLAVDMASREVRAGDLPDVPGFTVEVYAQVIDPMTLAFGPTGELYVGRDQSGSGGGPGDPARIHRIGVGGTPVVEFGAEIDDPDAVIVDVDGRFSGTPGAVLVGGEVLVGGGGQIHAILPDGTTVLLWDGLNNPTRMTYDHVGGLLYTDPSDSAIFATADSSVPQSFIPGSRFSGIAVASDGAIFTRSEEDDKIEIYDPNDPLAPPVVFTTGLDTLNPPPMDFCPGGVWDADLFTVSEGDLLRFDEPDGSSTFGDPIVIGTGFGPTSEHNTPSDITFGPDGALYVSMFSEDRVIRVFPDCNENGVPDWQDILDGAPDCNANGIPDECDIPGDINADGCVDLADLAELLANYMRCVYSL